jgi:glycosyltransferase involved in cell wall biosynthesis
MPEEYTDAGIWKEGGLLYRAVKRIEKWLLDKSDAFVVLTEKARSILFPESKERGFDKKGRPVEVIPCCVDLERFERVTKESRQAKRKELGLEDRFVVVYVGSFGGWYLTEEMADFWKSAKEQKPNTFALILTQGDPQMIKPLLEKRGFTDRDFLITKVAPKDIANLLCVGDVAISLIKSCYSKQSSSPTKNAEYFACGIPMIANTGIGDTDLMTTEDNVGVIMEHLTPDAYTDALSRLDKLLENNGELTQRCKESAKNRFHLEKVGGKRYRNIYGKLLGVK